MTGNSKLDYDKVNPNAYAYIFENPTTYEQAWDHPCSWQRAKWRESISKALSLMNEYEV